MKMMPFLLGLLYLTIGHLLQHYIGYHIYFSTVRRVAYVGYDFAVLIFEYDSLLSKKF